MLCKYCVHIIPLYTIGSTFLISSKLKCENNMSTTQSKLLDLVMDNTPTTTVGDPILFSVK